MIPFKIQERDGFLTMDDFPENCIFNKVKTGCGATTIALTNNENYIIAVPTKELVVNKCYPPKDKDGNDNIWKKSQIQPGVSPVNENLFGLYGNLNRTVKAKLKKFLTKDGKKKILCTYDKVSTLIPLINPLEFKILVDEYHNLLKQYGFRTKVINQVIEKFELFKSHCFLTATPIPEQFKPEIFAGITEYVADWETVDKITIYPCLCQSASNTAANIIKHYQNVGYFVLDGIKSEEAYFFVNSVREIKTILTKSKLTNDDCRIICADDELNHYKLEGFEISSSTAPAKRFTFVTCKAFEGVDFYSETAICFIVSSSNNKHTLISIDMDIPQIAGRIRTKSNPFRNKIVHIFNPKAINYYRPFDVMKEEINENMEAAEERVQLLNEGKLSKKAREQQDKEIERLGASTYIINKKGRYKVNDMVAQLKLYEHWTMRIVYKSAESLIESYKELGMVIGKAHEWDIKDEDVMKKALTPPQFRDRLKRFCDLKEKATLTDSEKQELKDITDKYPFLEQGCEKLGLSQLRRTRTIKEIKVLTE